MEREASARGAGAGERAARDAGKKAWQTPRLTTIDSRDAQSALTINSDGLYAAS